tara:strand:- start:28 stop:240 length:213 start_codon:yes stop_codon:yes gene_type:complete
MFGMSSDELREMAETSLHRAGTDDRHGDAMLVMSILSDAQEVMSYGDVETARQYINRAKYLLNYLVMNEE